MTPLEVPTRFERDMGCTPGELRASLAQALPGSVLSVDPCGASALAHFNDGSLRLSWSSLPPRRIALLEIPRLRVCFEYERLQARRRYEVQRHFDLVYQRGGG
jgi:hypothetical protein